MNSVKLMFLMLCLLVPVTLTQAAESPIKKLNHAVYQRDAPIVIKTRAKGRSGPLTVTFNGVMKNANYDGRSAFRVEFPAQPAGGPYTLDVTDKQGSYQAVDIYVWATFGSVSVNQIWCSP